jgi:outer membrane protein insertion porin family
VPGSNLTWYQLLNNITWYQALSRSVTLSLGGNVDYGNGYGSTNHLPFIDNFYGGGWGSVRGFEQGTMGPQDTVICTDTTNTVCQYGQITEGQALGGNLSVNASANLYFPVPFASDNPNLKLIAFVDSGNVYNTYRSSTVWNYQSLPTYPTPGNLRYSTGIGIEWVSPLGPLAFSVAQPLNSKSTDDTRMFQFSLGQFFN